MLSSPKWRHSAAGSSPASAGGSSPAGAAAVAEGAMAPLDALQRRARASGSTHREREAAGKRRRAVQEWSVRRSAPGRAASIDRRCGDGAKGAGRA